MSATATSTPHAHHSRGVTRSVAGRALRSSMFRPSPIVSTLRFLQRRGANPVAWTVRSVAAPSGRRSTQARKQARVGFRWLAGTALVALALGGAFVGQASTAGPGGWDHVGAGLGSPYIVNALNTDAPGQLLVAGAFTDAGGNVTADRIARTDGTNWAAVGSATDQINNAVYAIAYHQGNIFVGGAFTDAGGDPLADHLAVWNGVSWAPFCTSTVPGPSFTGNVRALQVIGSKLYVGGEFQNGAGIANADYMLVCDLTNGA